MADVDPLMRYCKCGHCWYFSKWDYVRMILFGGLTVRCPICHRKHNYRLIYHCIEEFSDTRKENDKLDKTKGELWKNA